MVYDKEDNQQHALMGDFSNLLEVRVRPDNSAPGSESAADGSVEEKLDNGMQALILFE